MGYGVGLALAFELSLGTNGTACIHGCASTSLPFRGLRVPARMAIVVGPVAGYSRRLRRRADLRGRAARAPRAIAAVVVIALAIAVEYRSTLVAGDRVAQAAAGLRCARRREPTRVLLELPLIAPDVALEPIYMYFSTFHWHPLVNGYSGFSPPVVLRSCSQAMADFPDDDTLEDLRRRGVDYVIVHGAFLPPKEYQRLVTRMDERPDLHLEGVTRWERKETRLYRVVK